MGRRKTPTVNLKLLGSRHARGRESEPQPPHGIPDMPPFISEDAKQYWAEVAKELEVAKVLTLTDAMSLGMLCECLAQFYEAQKAVQEDGMYVKDKMTIITGEMNIRVNPMLKIQNDAQDRFFRWAIQFGMTPSARAGITALAPEKKVGKAAGHFAGSA